MKKPTDNFRNLDSESLSKLLESDTANYDDILKRLAVREKMEVLIAEEAVKADKARQLEASLRATQTEIETKLRTQELCYHVKQNGRASVVGQKASHGHAIFLCQTCQKTWQEGELPQYLAITMSDVMIGGPA